MYSVHVLRYVLCIAVFQYFPVYSKGSIHVDQHTYATVNIESDCWSKFMRNDKQSIID